MFVQMICKDRNEKEMNELYEVLGLIARREEVQIEDRYDHVDILVCPQGKIVVTEEDGDCLLYTSPSPRDGATSRMPSSA